MDQSAENVKQPRDTKAVEREEVKVKSEGRPAKEGGGIKFALFGLLQSIKGRSSEGQPSQPSEQPVRPSEQPPEAVDQAGRSSTPADTNSRGVSGVSGSGARERSGPSPGVDTAASSRAGVQFDRPVAHAGPGGQDGRMPMIQVLGPPPDGAGRVPERGRSSELGEAQPVTGSNGTWAGAYCCQYDGTRPTKTATDVSSNISALGHAAVSDSKPEPDRPKMTPQLASNQVGGQKSQQPTSETEHKKTYITTDQGGEKLIWETHNVTLSRMPSFGFGIAVSGGRDNPHFANGDPSIAVSDVLKAGPAEGLLQINDRILSVNGISLENVDHATAISVLKDSGNTVDLVIRRKVILTSADDFEIPYKVTLNKKNKKQDYGIVLGCRLYIKEIVANSLAAQEGDLKEGDSILKINNQPIESLSLQEAKKQIEKCKDKLQLVVRSSHRPKMLNTASPHGTAESQQSTAPGHQNDQSQKQELKEPIYRTSRSAERTNLRPLSFDQLDRPATPLLEGQNVLNEDGPQRPPVPNHVTQKDGPPRPPSPIPAGYSNKPLNSSPYGEPYYGDHDSSLKRRLREPGSEPRFISFKKDDHGSVGICISGGNRSGIFVHRVAPNTPAEQQGLHEGDMILKVNDVDLRGKTREEALLQLTSLREQVNLLVMYRRDEYDQLMNSGGSGDMFYIRAHFHYSETEHNEMSFRPMDVFRVTNTLHKGIVGSWEVVKLSPHNNKDTKKGIIPNRNRAEQLCLAQNPDKENIPGDGKRGQGGSFFKKKTARRAKSLGKDHWDDIIFGMTGSNRHRTANPTSKFPVYENVVLRDVPFVRPVVILGPLADVASRKLVHDVPQRYMSPQLDSREDETRGKSTIIRLGEIREIRDRGKHAVLDITPNAIDRLNYHQFAPIVIFLRPESKQATKELRQKWARNSKKSYRKLYEHAVKLEKSFSYLFTHTIPLTNGLNWYRKLQETVEEAQRSPVWMSEVTPVEDNTRDDYLFPMGHRLSYASSPESDVEMRSHGMYDNEDDDVVPPARGQRLVRSSSDPSVNTMDNIPGIPPYPAPPGYRDPRDLAPYDRANYYRPYDIYDRPLPHQHHRGPPEAERRYRHPEERYYPHYYMDPRDTYGYKRSNIDPYATLTPSERLRGQHYDHGYPADMGRAHRSPKDRLRRRSALDHLPASGPPPVPPAGPPTGPVTAHPDNIYAYRMEPQPYDLQEPKGMYSDTDSNYIKYTSHPANKHDDSKLQEKFGSNLQTSTPEKLTGKSDPYRYTRSSMNPYHSASTDKAKPPDIGGKYMPNEQYGTRNATPPGVYQHPSSNSLRMPAADEPIRAKSESNVYQQSKSSPQPQVNPGMPPYFKSQPNLEQPRDIDRRPERQYEPMNRPRDVCGPDGKPYNSAFESYKKSSSPHIQQSPAGNNQNAVPLENSSSTEDGHTVVATARGVFDSNGGVLESKETGVSIIIPKGAIPEGVQQEIYFKVCQDNTILPPLDKDKGETLLSPLVMCGPHGLKFNQPVELRLPHCASLNPDSWSFALKSSGSPKGAPTQWQNMTLAGIDGVSQGKVGKNSVSVLVDHF